MPPFKTVHLDHVVLRVKDIDKSIAFYREVIGADVEREMADFGLFQLRIGGALIDLVPVDSPLGQQGGGPPVSDGKNLDHFAIRIEPFEVEAIKSHLSDHGVEVGDLGIRYGAEGNGPSVYIQDPDGNTVELKGPPRDTI